jgi:hypothetical protein
VLGVAGSHARSGERAHVFAHFYSERGATGCAEALPDGDLRGAGVGAGVMRKVGRGGG